MPIPHCNKFVDCRSVQKEQETIVGKQQHQQPQRHSKCPAIHAIHKKKCTVGPHFVHKPKTSNKRNMCLTQNTGSVTQVRKRLQSVVKDIKTAATLRGTVDWQTFNGGLQPTSSEQLAAQTKYSGSKVLLKQADFSYGTLRIRAPCLLLLTENVQFNPNPNDNWFPTAEQTSADGLYAGEEYTLGFFAAIAIETHHVMLDLNEKILEQSVVHALQQRFFAVVELADQPFIPVQGPADFGDLLEAASQTVVRNGTLGLSSHHGIHGNGNFDILLEDLVFRQYEVAGIALNGAHNVIIRSFTLEGTRTDVPVAATYSAARFLMLFINSALNATASNVDLDVMDARNQLQTAQVALQLQLDEAFDAVINDIGTLPPVFRLGNDQGVIDGNAFGILLNPLGVAVNGFTEKTARYDDPKASVSVLLEQGCIKNTFAAVDEVVALWNTASKRFVVDTAGSLLQFAKIVDQANGQYVGTSLSDAQIALAKLYNIPQAGLQEDEMFSVLNIPPDVVEWAQTGQSIATTLLVDNKYKYTRNGDSMAHVNKGVFGIKADGVAGLHISCVKVNNTVNYATVPDDSPLFGETANCVCNDQNVVCFTGPSDGGHPAQSKIKGSTSTDVRGICFAGCFDIVTKSVTIDGVESNFGSAIGIDAVFETTQVNAQGSKVKRVNASVNACPCDTSKGCKVPFAAGLHTGSDTKQITFCDTTVESSVDAVGGVATKASFDSLVCLTVKK